MMIESCLSAQRVAQIGFNFCREEAEPETSLSTLSWNIDTRCTERDRKTHMSDIVAIAFLMTGNCDEVLMTKLRTWLQQWVYMAMAKGYNSFTLAWTPRYFPHILLASSYTWPRICSRLSPSWDSWMRMVDARSLPVVEETGTKHKNSSCTFASLINRTDTLSFSIWLTSVVSSASIENYLHWEISESICFCVASPEVGNRYFINSVATAIC